MGGAEPSDVSAIDMKELLNHSGEVASEAWLQAQLQAGKSGMAGWAACVLADSKPLPLARDGT